MHYQVIARKFRPQVFEDVVGQTHVTRVIKNAIEMERLPHAFVFSGPRGVGKTSVARILAKAINCREGISGTPCNRCSLCEEITTSRAVDVFEIDAASHTGVDNIRDLIENSRYAPSVARYKTFIIDEAHMLSKSAFNALLKTLEEPPPHVIFILATTELSKIPPTVLSRCQRYDFRRIALEDIVTHLKAITDREGIRIDAEALMVIALQADGGMRDAQGMLEHVAATGNGAITVKEVEDMLGLVGRSTMHDLLIALVNRDAPSLLAVIDQVYRYGQDLSQLYRALLEQMRNMMVLKAGYENIPLPLEEKAFLQDLVRDSSFEEIHRALGVLIRAEEDLKFSSLPKITLETILLRIVAAPNLVDLQQILRLVASRTAALPLSQPQPPSPPEKYRRPPASTPRSWEGFLSYARDHDQALSAILAKTELLSEDEGEVRLAVPSAFLAEQVNRSLPDMLKRVRAFFQSEMRLKVEVCADPNEAPPRPRPSEIRSQAANTPMVKEIVSEFDGVIKDVKARE